MKAETLNGLFEKLKAACAKEPTAAQIDVLKESIIDNRLTDEEIHRGYKASRDAEDPWWPKPGEFLARARPPASAPVVAGEAETIFQLILDHPLRYGTYSPEVGTVWDRRKIEAVHGRAAGEAFGAVQGRFRTMESLADEKWVRKAFSDAYADSRNDHGAPLALTPPERRITAQEPKLVAGKEESIAEEIQRRYADTIRLRTAGHYVQETAPVGFDARKAELLRQAEALREPAQTQTQEMPS